MPKTPRIYASDKNPIGMIVASMLTEAQFQAANGTGWVLADRRGCVGSHYAAITGKTTVPDLRGMVLRGKNNGRADGFENPTVSISTVTRDLNSRNITMADTSDIHQGMLITGTGIPSETYVESISSATVVVMTKAATSAGTSAVTFSGDLLLGSFQRDQLGSHRHASGVRSADMSNGSWSSTATGTGIYTGYTGGNETRMKNVTVNYFIKINP